ncbi:cation-translocating P-type ATPase [Nocardia sp. NPDC003345]
MGPSVRSILSPRSITAPVTAVGSAVRAGAELAADTGRQAARVPRRAAEMAGTVATGLAPLGPDERSRIRDDLAALLDPRDRRAQRRVALTDDLAAIEIQGLANGQGSAVTRSLDRHLGRLREVQWWRVNAVTGRIVTALSTGADLDRLLAAIEEVEQETEVADEGWSRAAEFPADREPVLAAAIEVAGDVCAIAVSAAGAVPPLRGLMRGVRAAAAFTDAQPRLRAHLEERLGGVRTDLVLAIANAAGSALGEGAGGGVSNLVADAVQRGFVLTEAVARHAQWRRWQADIMDAEHFGVAEPLPEFTRPADLPRGPVERVADETATASLAGAATLAGLGRSHDIPDALLLGAPKAARAGREVFAATVSTTLAAAGVLTLHPVAWRRLDRLSALVVDAEALSTDRRVVLEAETTEDDWPASRVWNTAQRLLWSPGGGAGGEPGAALVHAQSGTPDQGITTRPVWRELREGERAVGRVLVGRELDPRAHSVLHAARRAGLRVVLAGYRDAGELRGLTDEFVSARGSLSAQVERLQQDGHGVAVLSIRAHKALDHADVAIGLLGSKSSGTHMPWTADLLCRDLTQVERTLTAIGPARQVSERGRTLALSACSLTGLLLTAVPTSRSRGAPIIAANVAGLFNGALSGLRATGDGPAPDLAPLLPWHALEPAEVLDRLPEPGAAATERASAEPVTRGRLPQLVGPIAGYLGHMRRELADPLTPVLGVGAAATAILGSPSDAVLLSSVLTVNAMISARQRQAAENELHELIEGERLSGRVIARGDIDNDDPDATELPADRLSVGDILLVRAGEVVAADARLLRADDLEMDESGLTGESVTVPKSIDATPGAALGERSCLIFEGTTVVSGSAVALVIAVGSDTQAGRATAGAVPPDKGGVQAQLRSLTDRALPLTLAGGGIVTALGGLRGRTLRDAISDGVGVAVAAVPEGLPLVATVAQLAAARRLSRYGVLVRANRAVEALGRIDTLCFDKTGTLTEGRLRLTALADLDEQWEPDTDSPDARRLLRAAARACPDPDDGPVLHATDRAVLDAAAEMPDGAAHRWDPLDEVPFESNRGYAAAIGKTAHKLRLMVKGAPEVVLSRCTAVRTADGSVPLDTRTRRRADAMVHELAEQGLRVLVVARRDLSGRPGDTEDAVAELTLLGFLGIADTPRPQTPYLVRSLQDNGIAVRMITGDHPVTAAAVARQLGITVDTVATGTDLDELDETGRTELIQRSTVFARVDPEQKVRIVSALRRSGHVVGMAGDGANDAAAIRTADIGIGLAAHGSAAARNAADLVLTEPDPRILLHALVEGRSMWQRVADAVAVLVGGNAGEIAFTLFGTAIGGRAPLGTRQFLLVNLLTDMFPALALALAGDQEQPATQNGDEWVEQRAAQLAAVPPAHLGADLIRTIAVRGVATATGASAAWMTGRFTGTQRRADTIGLVALIGTQLGQTLVAGYRSPLVWVTTAASGAVLGVVVMTPGLGAYFGCTPLGPVGWTIATTAAAAATAGAAVLPRFLTEEQDADTASEPITGPEEAARLA